MCVSVCVWVFVRTTNQCSVNNWTTCQVEIDFLVNDFLIFWGFHFTHIAHYGTRWDRRLPDLDNFDHRWILRLHCNHVLPVHCHNVWCVHQRQDFLDNGNQCPTDKRYLEKKFGEVTKNENDKMIELFGNCPKMSTNWIHSCWHRIRFLCCIFSPPPLDHFDWNFHTSIDPVCSHYYDWFDSIQCHNIHHFWTRYRCMRHRLRGWNSHQQSAQQTRTNIFDTTLSFFV